jgi:hypothetical protein
LIKNESLDFGEALKVLRAGRGEKFKKEGDDGYSDFFVLVRSGADVILSEKRPEVDFVHSIFFIQSQVSFSSVVNEPFLSL